MISVITTCGRSYKHHAFCGRPRLCSLAAGGLTECLSIFSQEGDALGVAAIANGDVHRAAGVDGVVVHRGRALIRMHMACA